MKGWGTGPPGRCCWARVQVTKVAAAPGRPRGKMMAWALLGLASAATESHLGEELNISFHFV